MIREDSAYDKKSLIKYLIILGTIMAASHFTGGYAIALVPVLLIVAMMRKNHAALLLWMLVLVFSAAGNRYFFSQNAYVVLIARLGLLFVAGVLMLKVFGQRNAVTVKPLFGVFLYIAWEALISIQGWSPIISYLKLTLFTITYMSFYAIANEIAQSGIADARQVRSAVLAIACILLLGSVAVIPFPGISQLKALRANGEVDQEVLLAIAEGRSLFTGMTNHSQALGTTVGILATLIFGDLIFSVRKWSKIYVLLLVVCPILLYKTSSRTAMGTFLAGTGMVVLLFLQAHKIASKWRGKVVSALFAVGLFGCVGILVSPNARDSAMRFLLKAGKDADVVSSDVTIERFTSSRQGLIDMALYNFAKKPMVGNGFQVSKEMEKERRSGFMSYLSAPIEKGVWITAVLEEGGVPGLFLFGGFLIIAILTLIRRYAYISASMVWVVTVANLGEFSFFSMSYVGGLFWGLVFAGTVLDGVRMKNLGLLLFETADYDEGVDMWTNRLA